jgi:hypothetical protein
MRATRRNLQAQPKIQKKSYWNTTQYENFLKKTMFRTLKMERSQKFVWELPDGICRLDPKSSKKLKKHKINQPKQNFSQKKNI